MSSCLKAGFSVSGSSDVLVRTRDSSGLNSRVCPPVQFMGSNSKEFWGKSLDFSDCKGGGNLGRKAPKLDTAHVSNSCVFSPLLEQLLVLNSIPVLFLWVMYRHMDLCHLGRG